MFLIASRTVVPDHRNDSSYTKKMKKMKDEHKMDLDNGFTNCDIPCLSLPLDRPTATLVADIVSMGSCYKNLWCLLGQG